MYMRILYIYRNPKMGYSIGKVFKPIEKEINKFHCVHSIELPSLNYKIKGLYKNITYLLDYCKRNKYDIIHITGPDYYLIPFLKKENLVVTVHDLGFYTNQKKSMKSLWIYFSRVRTINQSRRVTFISEKSLNECKRLINLSTEKCKVIANPLDSSYFGSKEITNNEKPVILQIGTSPNKNIERTIIALKDINCHYRIVGKLSDDYKKMLYNNNIDYSNVYNLSDDEVLEEYINCDIVCFPSLYEGFGMPIIEGQAVGRIVVTSNLSPMKEIAGEGSAIFVDPYDVKSIHEGIIKAMQKPMEIINKGRINAERYKVENITQSYINLYKELL